MSTSSPQTPIQIHIPLSLQQYAIPLPRFTTAHPKYAAFGTGAFIFHNNALLLIQRAATESSANLWEVPGGGSEPSDPTILHSAARETFEETGLRLTRFVRQFGKGQEFLLGKGELCLKLNFEIEVAEIHGSGHRGDHQHADGDEGMEPVETTLDPEEHQAYAWASEEDVQKNRYPIVTEDQKVLLLEAFALRKIDSERLQSMIDGARKRI